MIINTVGAGGGGGWTTIGSWSFNRTGLSNSNSEDYPSALSNLDFAVGEVIFPADASNYDYLRYVVNIETLSGEAYGSVSDAHPGIIIYAGFSFGPNTNDPPKYQVLGRTISVSNIRLVSPTFTHVAPNEWDTYAGNYYNQKLPWSATHKVSYGGYAYIKNGVVIGTIELQGRN